ncbi:DUF6265 family protein [Flavobacterium sp.]|uniref:DUF6265 family protein n=1 Tax=Flavobacterium sp. TaxID=239 RepID=UPI00286E18EF|nr:DUF6265 family protein [Flavobacterium sp.]
MKNAIYSITLLLLLASCQKSKEVSKIVGKEWLLGQWENKSDEGNLLEIWKKANDSIYIGESYFIKEKDTLHSEKIELKQKGENLLYISTIKGQNNDKPVTFNHNIEIEKQLVFENPKNEYPRKIVYKRIAKDRIFIEVSGIEQGKPTSIRYSMKKTD